MKTLISKYNDIWNTQQIEQLSDVFLKSGTYKDALQEGNAVDILSVSIIETAKAFSDVTLEITSTNESVDGKHITIEWLMKGTNTGSFFGAEPTNKKIEVLGLDLIKVKEGKISVIKSYYDTHQFVNQLEL